jgi:hypothetical protein
MYVRLSHRRRYRKSYELRLWYHNVDGTVVVRLQLYDGCQALYIQGSRSTDTHTCQTVPSNTRAFLLQCSIEIYAAIKVSRASACPTTRGTYLLGISPSRRNLARAHIPALGRLCRVKGSASTIEILPDLYLACRTLFF